MPRRPLPDPQNRTPQDEASSAKRVALWVLALLLLILVVLSLWLYVG